jgi:hypothetical protein
MSPELLTATPFLPDFFTSTVIVHLTMLPLDPIYLFYGETMKKLLVMVLLFIV